MFEVGCDGKNMIRLSVEKLISFRVTRVPM